MGHVIKGKDVAEKFLIDVTSKLPDKDEVRPTLAIVRIGNHPSEIAYEKSVIKRLNPLGIECVSYVFEKEIEEAEFNRSFDEINQNPQIHSILLLKPVPKHISLDHVIQTIDPLKDVDAIGLVNMAKIYQEGQKGFIPCTAEAVTKILEYQKIELKGTAVTMVGFGMVIGRPLTLLLLESGSTVTVCNEFTKDLKTETSRADVLIVATGVIHLIEEDFVKEGATVIDVGINVDKKGRLVGDVNFEDVKDKASSITPVPGGVGTVTTYVLASHVLESFRLQMKN